MKQDVHLAMKFQVNHINMTNKDEYYMSLALNEAKKAYKKDEVPVGAIIVKDDKIISKGQNQRIKLKKISRHAEIVAIEKANKKLKSLNLSECTIYVSLEPCPMCSYAIIDSHIKRLVYAAKDEKRGAISNLDIFNKSLGSKVEVCGNILSEESSILLKEFFKNKR